MVWWIDNYESGYCRRKFPYYETSMDSSKDRIFQTTSIMYNLDDGCYDAYDIKFLTTSGVNIFNVDRTLYGEDVFQKIKEAITISESIHKMYPEIYHRPIGLSVIMTVTERIDIDDRIDIIILKNVKNLQDLLGFKKHYRNKQTISIIPWIKTLNLIDLNQIIKFSDGIVVDDSNTVEENCCKINLCKQVCKPVIYVAQGLIDGYGASAADDRKVYSIANKIAKDKLDAVLLPDNNKNVRGETKGGLIKSLVIAIDDLEDTNNRDKEFYELNSNTKIPALPPKSMAIAACLAAKQSGASAIIVFTSSGSSARLVANAAPPCHILAVTSRKKTARLLHLYRKVIPVFYNQTNAVNWEQERWNRVQYCTAVALQIGICHNDANVVILAPSSEGIGYCNSLQIFSLPLICEQL